MLSAGDQDKAVFVSAGAAHVNQKKTIRGLLGSRGDVTHRASPRLHGPSSEPAPQLKTVRGIVSPNYTETRGPFLCCHCHACPIPFSCLTASPCPPWKCAN